MRSRRQFLGTLFRSVATAAALAYAPSALCASKPMFNPGNWTYYVNGVPYRSPDGSDSLPIITADDGWVCVTGVYRPQGVTERQR